MYWVDGSLVVEPGLKNAAERFTVQDGRRKDTLVEGCYTKHFQLSDGSVVYSLIACDFKSAAVYHWRPGHVPRELRKETRKAEDGSLPTLTLKHLGASSRVLISEKGKEPLLLDAATDATRTLTLAAPELVQKANEDASWPDETSKRFKNLNWTWFEDVAFNSDQQGNEIIYTRCSGDDYRPICATFRQSIDPQGAPELLRGPAGQAIRPVLRRGQYLFCTVGGEVEDVYRLDLQSLAWRPVVSNVTRSAFSPNGVMLAVANLHPNVLVLTYDEASGTFIRPRRVTNFPAQRSGFYLDLEWLKDTDLVIRVEIDESFAGGWRANLDTGSMDLLWQSKDATQDVFFDYVRQQKGQKTYSVRIPRTTLVSEASARLIAKASVLAIGLVVLAFVVLVSRRSRSRAVAALPLLCVWMCSCGTLQSENSEAIRLIEENWNTVGRYDVLPIGEVQIVRSNGITGSTPDLSKGQTSPDDMHAYEVLRQQNAIIISSNTDLTSNNNFTWNNFFALSQQGVIRRLTVALATPGDEKLRCPDDLLKQLGTQKLICIETGAGTVQEIVRSQKFQIGTTKCWLIMGNHRWKWSETERKVRDRQGKVSEENMKFMAIAQYEDFAKKWQLALIDHAPRAGQFAKQKQFDNVLKQATITDSQK